MNIIHHSYEKLKHWAGSGEGRSQKLKRNTIGVTAIKYSSILIELLKVHILSRQQALQCMANHHSPGDVDLPVRPRTGGRPAHSNIHDIHLIGMNFYATTRNIDHWLVEEGA